MAVGCNELNFYEGSLYGVKWQLSYKQIGKHQKMHPKTLELVSIRRKKM